MVLFLSFFVKIEKFILNCSYFVMNLHYKSTDTNNKIFDSDTQVVFLGGGFSCPVFTF